MHSPFVSVVIPVLNGEAEIEACLAALAQQDYPPDRFEIIIVDNGSTDDTVKVLKKFKVRLYTRQERGRSCALNTGIEHARGEIICTTDISCQPEPQWISSVINSFKDSDVGCVAGEIRLLKTNDKEIIKFQERCNYMSAFLALNRKKPPFLPFSDGANASFRKIVFEEIGLFDESFIKGADVEICYRMFVLTSYKIVFNRQALVWEPGEPTLKDLLRQRFRMGIGWNLMQMKYPSLYQNNNDFSLRKVYWRVYNLLRKLRYMLASNFYGWFYLKTKSEAYDANVKFLMGISQTLGRFYGWWYLRAKNIRPVPVDKSITETFLSSGGDVSHRVIVTG